MHAAGAPSADEPAAGPQHAAERGDAQAISGRGSRGAAPRAAPAQPARAARSVRFCEDAAQPVGSTCSARELLPGVNGPSAPSLLALVRGSQEIIQNTQRSISRQWSDKRG